MNIDYYDIKSERQENGLWGTPMKLMSMEGLPFDIDLELHSAIVIGMSEIYDSKFNIKSQSSDSFLITFDNPVLKHPIFKYHYTVVYDRFVLDGNRLYFIKTEKERRFLKINKINESV